MNPLPPQREMTLVLDRVREITRENERLFHELVAGQRRYRALARSVWSVQEGERRRLARELHDGIGQTLTALMHRLEGLRSLPQPPPPEMTSRLDDALALASQALEETRQLSRLLRPQILDDLGLEPALRWLARTAGGEMAVTLNASGLEQRLGPELETLAFRVAQEALNNAAKHARARSARLEVEVAAGSLRIEVCDDGRGFETSDLFFPAGEPDGSSSGFGLRGMRDRVELFGGTLEVRSSPGEGTRVVAEVPLAEDRGEEP